MSEYKKFLILQYGSDGPVGDVVDSQRLWNIVCQECPFKHLPETKDLPKRDWFDEDGDDVYIPTDGIKIKAYDMDVQFLYVGEEADMSTNLKGFIDFICGRTNIINGSIVTTNVTRSVLLKVYDEYTKTGRQGVYVQSVDNELYFFNDVSVDAIAQFKVKFRVTDPVTEIVLDNETPTVTGNG